MTTGSRRGDGMVADTGTTTPPSALDRVMPTWDARIVVCDMVDCSADRAWSTVSGFDLLKVRSPLITVSFALRAFPARLLRRPEPPPPPELKLTGGPGLPGWVGLSGTGDRETAAGAIGVFWTPAIVWHPEVSSATFADFDEPGWGRIAISISVTPRGPDSSFVVYECRTRTTDETSRARFRWYWRLIQPVVAHIMKAVVRTIKAEAEATLDISQPDPAD